MHLMTHGILRKLLSSLGFGYIMTYLTLFQLGLALHDTYNTNSNFWVSCLTHSTSASFGQGAIHMQKREIIQLDPKFALVQSYASMGNYTTMKYAISEVLLHHVREETTMHSARAFLQ